MGNFRFALACFLLAILSIDASAQSSPEVVHFNVTPAGASSPNPQASALFSYTNPEGILVWEAGVPAVPGTQRGRIFVDQTGSRRTAVAVSADFLTSGNLDLILADSEGVEIGRTTRSVSTGQQLALFVDELFPNAPENLIGSLTLEFDTDPGVGVVTLRGTPNSSGETVFATLEVANLDQTLSAQTAVIPQVGGAPGFSSQIVLINPFDQPVAGKIELRNSDGLFELELNGQEVSQFEYSLPAKGVRRFELVKTAGVGVGYAVATVTQGPAVPVVSAIFQYQDETLQRQGSASAILSEAGILTAESTTAARLFVDSLDTRTGIALSNYPNGPNRVTLKLHRGDGSIDEFIQDVVANGHLALFADEVFDNLQADDSLLEVVSEEPIYLTPLKLTINRRGHPILTTLPFLDMTRLVRQRTLIPQVAFGAGLNTRLVFVAPAAGSSATTRQRGIPCWYLDVMNPAGQFSDINLVQNIGSGFEVCSESIVVLDPGAPGTEVPLGGSGGLFVEMEPELYPATNPCCDTEHEGGTSIDGNGGPVRSVTDPGDAGFAYGSGIGIYLHSGESYVTETDLEIPGRGFSWRFERKYRSGAVFEGPLGHNWEFNYNRRLAIVGDDVQPVFGPRLANPGDVIRMDGLSRVDLYRVQPDGSYRSPTGFYTRLWQEVDGTFVERDAGGMRIRYARPDARGIALMISMTDRNGNQMKFQYDRLGRLNRVIDTLGRTITYQYNASGQLEAVRDFSGRSVHLGYDPRGDLVQVTSPRVTGTPNGNDFPRGKSTAYGYSQSEDSAHKLISITAPNEVASGGSPRITLKYDAVGRVTEMMSGGTNVNKVPAGGMVSYEYGVNQTSVTDRNGNLTRYFFNELGNIIRRQEFTNRGIRPGDPQFFETRFEYNEDGNLTRTRHPEGNSIELVYDENSSNRHQQGNLLQRVLRADANRSGDQDVIIESFTHEPVYNLIRTSTDPRGSNPGYLPQNGGAATRERYTTTHTFDYQEGENLSQLAQTMGLSEGTVVQLLSDAGVPLGLGDLNGDGLTSQLAGNTVRTESPSISLLPGSLIAEQIEQGPMQPISVLHRYNRFGQIISTRDPEGNLTLFDYYPENDPDGDGQDLIPELSDEPGGYLRGIRIDAVAAAERNSGTNPEPVSIRTRYFYDDRGNLTREIDGRGISTEYRVNQLNQVAEVRRATRHEAFLTDPAEPLPLTNFNYSSRFFYDYNDNLVLTQTEDRGNTSLVDGNPPAGSLPTPLANPDPAGGKAWVDQVIRYDILDNPIEFIDEANAREDVYLRSRHRYDPNGNLVLTIKPEGNAETTVYDERDLVFSSTVGAPGLPELVHLAVDDPVSYIVRGGTPASSFFIYDLNGNTVETVDAADTDSSAENNSDIIGTGDRTRFLYDGFDRLTGMVDSVGNQSVIQYDPASNEIRTIHFGPVGGLAPTEDGADNLSGPVSIDGIVQTGNLVSTNPLSVSEAHFDELNRLFQADQVLFVNTIPLNRPADVAAGATDVGKGDLTPSDAGAIAGLGALNILGRVSSRIEYDRNSRPIFAVEDDGDVRRSYYDGANRLIKTVDPEANLVEMAYDDNGNVIEIRETDVSQVAGIADEIFLTTHFYDSLNRLERKIDNLGQTHYYRYDSRDNLVAVADASGPQGETIERRFFEPGTRTVNQTNRFGNVTLHYYDGVSRMVSEEAVLTSTGQGDGTYSGANESGIKENPPSLPSTQGGGDGKITTRYEWNANSLLVALIDDNGNQTQYTYDDLDRPVSETKGVCVEPALADRCDPPATAFYTYDPDHNIIQTTDENGSIVLCSFDALNRRTGCQIFRGAGVVGTTQIGVQYDGLSRAVRFVDNNFPDSTEDDVTSTFAYDSLGRLIEETQQIGNSTAQVISSSWRAEALRTGLTYPNGRLVTTTYDELDRIDTITDQSAPLPLVNYDYMGIERILEKAYPENGTRLTFLGDGGPADSGYDGLRRPVQLRHLRGDGSLIVGFSHSYDRMNNKLNESKLHDSANNEEYSYDSAYRLIRFSRPDAGGIQALQNQWQLDGVGNWRQVDEETRLHSSFNEIVQRTNGADVSLLHDGSGNLTDSGELLLSWDYRNRLRGVSRKSDGALVATYVYDASNRRVQKSVQNSGELNGITRFYYDDWSVLEEQDGEGGLLQQFVYGSLIDEPLLSDRNLDANGDASEASDSRRYYHQNHLGSVYGLTDGGGQLVEAYQYDAYGATLSFSAGPNGRVDFGADDDLTAGAASGNRFTFTARRWDSESGLFYSRNRFYAADLGRFLSRDPLGYQADPSNLYQYARSNSVNSTDPLGLWTIFIGGSGELAAGGSAKSDSGFVLEVFSSKSWFDFGVFTSGGVGGRVNLSASATVELGVMGGSIEDFEGGGFSGGVSGGEGVVGGLDYLESDSGRSGIAISGGIGAGLAPVDVGGHRTITKTFMVGRDLIPLVRGRRALSPEERFPPLAPRPGGRVYDEVAGGYKHPARIELDRAASEFNKATKTFVTISTELNKLRKGERERGVIPGELTLDYDPSYIRSNRWMNDYARALNRFILAQVRWAYVSCR